MQTRTLLGAAALIALMMQSGCANPRPNPLASAR